MIYREKMRSFGANSDDHLQQSFDQQSVYLADLANMEAFFKRMYDKYHHDDCTQSDNDEESPEESKNGIAKQKSSMNISERLE